MIKLWIACVIGFTAIGAAPAFAAASVEVFPTPPRYMEPVYARIHSDPFAPSRIWDAQVSMTGNTITIVFKARPELDICGCFYDVELGRLPSGDYTVEVAGFGLTTHFTVLPSQQASPFPGSVPAVDYSGIWWNPDEPGWGMHIEQGPTNIIFAVWLVYDSMGKPVWYTLGPGTWLSTNSVDIRYTGPIYKTSGPYFGGPYDPAALKISLIGSGTLGFGNPDSGGFQYVVEGVAGSKSLVRMSIE